MAFISQPSNVIPSSLSGIGDGVVDVTNGLQVSWTFSGSPMVAYRLFIYQNDSASTEKLDTEKVVLQNAFYPYDSKGEQQVFYATKITAATLAEKGIVNGYSNGYKLVIRMYYGNGQNDYVEQSSASAFITRKNPTLSINTITSPVTERTITITGSYAQQEGDPIEWVNWYLVDDNDRDDYLINTGKLNTEILSLTYDGLLTGTDYAVRLIVQTINGVQVDTGWYVFSVEYDVSPSAGLVSVCRPYNAPYIQVSWINETRINGTPTGQYSFESGKLNLPSGSNVLWNKNGTSNLVFGHPWTLSWRGKRIDYTNSIDAVVMEGDDNTYKIVVTNSGISLTHGSTTVFTKEMTMLPNDEFVVIVTENKYYIKQITRNGGLFPRDDLYPEDNLYPVPLSLLINNFTGDITYTQEKITSFKLNGQQRCEYLWLESGTLDQTTIGYLIGTDWYEPRYDSKTCFIATFADSNLEASITPSNGDEINGASVYRKNASERVMKHLVDVEENYTIFRDYGAKARESYMYYVFQRGGETYVSAPSVSAEITPNFATYSLMECEQTTEGEFHVIKCFTVSGNLDSGIVTNNNKVTTNDNFTKYPSVQHSTINYKSGTLTSLIGTINRIDNSYSDTWSIADEIMELSTSLNPKFLRDTKGALWRIETNGPVQMEVDDTKSVLPIKMQFPWVEVDSAEGIAVVLSPTDEMWEDDGIIETTLTIDIETGELIWSVPEVYNGSELVINAGGELVENGNGLIVPATLTINSKANLIAQV